ncbi:MAG: hypothetical protein Ct9H300mP28_03180 [Pseudomonadota bacterium]|nr:MAG: hypothetical protein Ct9H300mP28_03180 [Pseudomonadota bacterium]
MRKLSRKNFEWILKSRCPIQLGKGPCDERGTKNKSGFGERRAKAVFDYLVGPRSQSFTFTIVSFGEEGPSLRQNEIPGVKIESRVTPFKYFGASSATLITLESCSRMARRNEHSRTGTWWKFHRETGVVHFGFNVGPFLGRHNYKGPSVF